MPELQPQRNERTAEVLETMKLSARSAAGAELSVALKVFQAAVLCDDWPEPGWLAAFPPDQHLRAFLRRRGERIGAEGPTVLWHAELRKELLVTSVLNFAALFTAPACSS